MEVRQDHSTGIIPVHTGADGVRFFCLVHHVGGHWAFPKGHIDAGESKEAAARRELYEETGILTCRLDIGRIFIERYFFEKEGVRYDKEVTYFLGFVERKEPVAPKEAFMGEIVEARWCTYEEAKEILTFPEAQKLLEEVLEYLRSNKQET
mgnify:CR=1 FL=1